MARYTPPKSHRAGISVGRAFDLPRKNSDYRSCHFPTRDDTFACPRFRPAYPYWLPIRINAPDLLFQHSPSLHTWFDSTFQINALLKAHNGVTLQKRHNSLVVYGFRSEAAGQKFLDSLLSLTQSCPELVIESYELSLTFHPLFTTNPRQIRSSSLPAPIPPPPTWDSALMALAETQAALRKKA
jgi:hypothetical protein